MIDIPLSLKVALEEEAKKNNVTRDGLISAILAEHVNLNVHTVFQVSTSGALVAGVYDQEVTVGALLEHGDFGLGTFAGLDGEMVVLDGRVYQAHGSGKVTEARADAGAPFAVITRFTPDMSGTITDVTSFSDLEARCDGFRASDNIFYALRLHGRFSYIKTRVVNPPEPGVALTEAAKSQSEFELENIAGTLVGIWSPVFSSQFSVAGYHFHFISDDHEHGGHLLDVKADSLSFQIENLNDFRLVLPETETYLKANLDRDIAAELNAAERGH
ncbi:acetolactate decarboxylase [Ancylobacter lacus]|uniref:acetolactate decarboxylase n=1 Tax=Ancylobacter lacus TaxID=2579970 RepID=UPI001BD034D4|nr:acetolactate decarboxylase [Ancylobacter lacus]MBS7537734.1 acetolactate decarboxylase [Ancylobacter lacus]